MEYVSETTSPKRKAKFVAGGIAVVVIVAGLIVWAMSRPGSSAYWMTVAEVRSAPPAYGSDYRVKGNVVPGSLKRKGIETTFAISDESGDELEIVTDEALPDAFWTAYENDPVSVEVIAQGTYDGTMFAASQVLAKCPSKFKAKT